VRNNKLNKNKDEKEISDHLISTTIDKAWPFFLTSWLQVLTSLEFLPQKKKKKKKRNKETHPICGLLDVYLPRKRTRHPQSIKFPALNYS